MKLLRRIKRCFPCHSYTDAWKWSGRCKVPLTASTRSLQGALLWEARWDVTKPGRGWWGGRGLPKKQWSPSSPPSPCNAWRSAHFLRLEKDQLCTHEHCFQFHRFVAVKCGTTVRTQTPSVWAQVLLHMSGNKRQIPEDVYSCRLCGKFSSFNIRRFYRNFLLLRFMTFFTKAYVSNRSQSSGKPLWIKHQQP